MILFQTTVSDPKLIPYLVTSYGHMVLMSKKMSILVFSADLT